MTVLRKYNDFRKKYNEFRKKYKEPNLLVKKKQEYKTRAIHAHF